eukprot:scaffold6781_cov204-Amphora_coffeaeformis.AAC.30
MATTTTTLANILQLNQDGVIFLRKGEYVEALRSFHVALSTVTVSLCHNQPSSDSAKAGHALAPALVSDLHDDEETAFSVYGNAFITEESMTDADQATMLLLYNFALTWHLRGLSERKNIFLVKALKVYDLLRTMFQAHPQIEGHGWRLLKLALWANMGHIHSLNFSGNFAMVVVELGSPLLDPTPTVLNMQQ